MKYVFTLVGGHISPILVACEKLGISVVDTRHEVRNDKFYLSRTLIKQFLSKSIYQPLDCLVSCPGKNMAYAIMKLSE